MASLCWQYENEPAEIRIMKLKVENKGGKRWSYDTSIFWVALVKDRVVVVRGEPFPVLMSNTQALPQKEIKNPEQLRQKQRHVKGSTLVSIAGMLKSSHGTTLLCSLPGCKQTVRASVAIDSEAAVVRTSGTFTVIPTLELMISSTLGLSILNISNSVR